MRHVHRGLSDGGHCREVMGRRGRYIPPPHPPWQVLIAGKAIPDEPKLSLTGAPRSPEKSIARCFRGILLMFVVKGWKAPTPLPLSADFPSPLPSNTNKPGPSRRIKRKEGEAIQKPRDAFSLNSLENSVSL